MKARLSSRKSILVSATIIATLCASALSRAALVAAWGDNTYNQTRLPQSLNDIKTVAAGQSHGLALRANGQVIGWGSNGYGEANVPPTLTSVRAVAAGKGHSLALRADGTVAAWGLNQFGQTNAPDGLSGVIAIAAGGPHSLALKVDGTVVGWGYNAFGQTNIPSGLTDVISISAGEYHNLALRGDGTVVAWGRNAFGETNVPPGLSNVIAVAAGGSHSLALKTDGQVIGWGLNQYGVTIPPASATNVTAIAAGYSHSTALRADGTVLVWGQNSYGQTNVPSGLSNATAIAAAEYYNVALVAEGPIQIIQHPANQNVSYTSNVSFSVTALGYGPIGYQWYFNGSTDSARISGATNASLAISNAQFSNIGTYAVVVSNAFGSVQSSGAVLTVISPPIITQQPVGRTVIAGTNITLAAAAVGTPPLRYQWSLNAGPISGATNSSLTLTNVQSNQSGNYSLRVTNVYGVTDSSNALVTVLESPPYILAQPTNRSGFLGGNATFSVNARGSTPLSYQWRFNGVDIPGATNVTFTLTSLRYDQAGFYTAAVSNAFGVTISAKAQLSVSQVAVWASSLLAGSLTNVPAGLTNLVAIAAGEYHLLALKSDGTVAAWSSDFRFWPPGSVNPVTNIPAGLSGVTAIAAGSSHSLALKSNGTVVAWGDNDYGQTNVPTGLSNVIAVAAGDLHSLALKTDGRVVAWGARSTFGLPSYSFPELTNVPPSLSNVIAITAGFDRSLALRNDGKVVAWGFAKATNVPATLSNVIAIACGTASGRTIYPPTRGSVAFNLALRANGTVVSWPADGVSAPLSPPIGLTNVVAIAAGGHGMALKADGSVAVWGLTNPPPPQGLSNIIGIAAGYGFAAAIAGDGSPFFTLQPVGQTVVRGSKVQFHARAVGVQPMTYRWQLDGVNLSGATNADLTITNAQGRDAGGYRVVVSNGLGSATSAIATLTIPFSTNLAAALNATNLVWTTSPTNAPWFAQIRETHDGDVAAQSGRISHNQESILQTATVVGPGTLTFWWKVSSEEGYDFLRFFANAPDFAPIFARISGETGWQKQTFFLPMGANEFRWVYSKDSTVSAGQDAGWVDEVAFAPSSALMLSAPSVLPDGSLVFASRDAGGRSLLLENLAAIEVQASTNLSDWITLTNACALTNGALLVRDPDCARYHQRFYRVVEH